MANRKFMTPQDVHRARRLRDTGMTYKAIACRLGFPMSTVASHAKGQRKVLIRGNREFRLHLRVSEETWRRLFAEATDAGISLNQRCIELLEAGQEPDDE